MNDLTFEIKVSYEQNDGNFSGHFDGYRILSDWEIADLEAMEKWTKNTLKTLKKKDAMIDIGYWSGYESITKVRLIHDFFGDEYRKITWDKNGNAEQEQIKATAATVRAAISEAIRELRIARAEQAQAAV